jgi:uncharacterized protein (DUF362 family)/Pyruvate/2-oxoacid:ferredoxin oxidoreductase delta subunit
MSGSVSLVRCGDYDFQRVKASVRQSLELLGGISAFVKPGERVLLKVNLLMRRKPEKATTTHPSVARALAELVREAGGKPVIGDSPGGYHFYTASTLRSVYETCGMAEAARESGAELNWDTEVVDVPYPEGRRIKLVKTIRPVLEVDKIISVPKLKTHGMTVYSGAVKNLFGIIPGRYKGEYHLRFEDVDDFADLLVDLCQFAKPVLSVMDAVVGMEGYGPTNGRPRAVGLIISSPDPYALDVVAAEIIGLKGRQVPTIRKSAERGLCPLTGERLTVLGQRVPDVAVPTFSKPTVRVALNFYGLLLPAVLKRWLDNLVKPKPRLDPDACSGCGECEKGCPPKAIRMIDQRPSVDLTMCIRCFCCNELCPRGAFAIARPWFLRLLLRGSE